ncbi:MAG: hypothetical protein IBX56_18025, partial [Methylomicrobium sp.]|nr:hypothetical protein [Methylomicrobium sp.]
HLSLFAIAHFRTNPYGHPLYLKAERQHRSAHWADNTGKGAAGKKAMEILATGGSIEDAETALNERRTFID